MELVTLRQPLRVSDGRLGIYYGQKTLRVFRSFVDLLLAVDQDREALRHRAGFELPPGFPEPLDGGNRWRCSRPEDPILVGFFGNSNLDFRALIPEAFASFSRRREPHVFFDQRIRQFPKSLEGQANNFQER